MGIGWNSGRGIEHLMVLISSRVIFYTLNGNFFQCHFEGEERDCTEIFIPVITDDGG